MKLSEIMVSDVAEYVREEEGEPLLPHILEAARRYVLDYTGLSAEEADGHADLSIAALAVRTTAITGTIIAENPVVAQILGAHAVNLL